MPRRLPVLVLVTMALQSTLVYAQQPAPVPAPAPTPAPSPAPAPAPAGAPSAADGPNLESAKVHFQQGVALYNDGNFNAALAEFVEAYRLRKSPGVLYNIGLTQKSLFRYGEAIESLQQYLAEGQALAPERQAEVTQLINEMRALLADLTLTIEPPGASIVVDGRTMGQAPLAKPLGVAAGNHTLEVTFEGYKPVRKELMVSAGVAMKFTFKLELIPKSGKVHISSSQPLSTVVIDGKPLGYAPLDTELGLGGHTLEVSAPRYLPHRSELVIAAGQRREVSVALELPARRQHVYEKWYFWTPLVLVAAGAAVGLGLGLTQRPEPLAGTLSPGVGNVN